MRIHYLQHVPFEDPGSMAVFLREQGHRLTGTRLDLGRPLPDVEEFDWLIVLGGPMGVADTREYPWLSAEQDLIARAIAAGRRVLGVCLGAQLIAAALGARVMRNPHREIGWFEIVRDPAVAGTLLDPVLPERCEVYHWHGDTFAIPAGARPLASSAACRHQGFILEDRVIALQFHLETTPASARALIANAAAELDGSRFVQSSATMLAEPERFVRINRLMEQLLGAMAAGRRES